LDEISDEASRLSRTDKFRRMGVYLQLAQ